MVCKNLLEQRMCLKPRFKCQNPITRMHPLGAFVCLRPKFFQQFWSRASQCKKPSKQMHLLSLLGIQATHFFSYDISTVIVKLPGYIYCSFTSYGLAWSTMCGLVSMPPRKVRFIFLFWPKIIVRTLYAQWDPAMTEIRTQVIRWQTNTDLPNSLAKYRPA